MKTYFEARKERLILYDGWFKQLTEDLKAKGCRVWGNKDGYFTLMHVQKDDKHLWISFSEVPYRFVMSISFKPNPEQGSGAVIHERYIGDDTPLFTADEVMETLAPITHPIRLNFLKEL